jgi:hypothetical protein
MMNRNIDILSVCQMGMVPVSLGNGEHPRWAHRPQAYAP